MRLLVLGVILFVTGAAVSYWVSEEIRLRRGAPLSRQANPDPIEQLPSSKIELEPILDPSVGDGDPSDLHAALQGVVRSNLDSYDGSIRGCALRSNDVPWAGLRFNLIPIGAPPGDVGIKVEKNSLVEYVRRRVVHHDFRNLATIEVETDRDGRFEVRELKSDHYRLDLLSSAATVLVQGETKVYVRVGDDVTVIGSPRQRALTLELSGEGDVSVDAATVTFSGIAPFDSGVDSSQSWTPSGGSLQIPREALRYTVEADGFFAKSRALESAAGDESAKMTLVPAAQIELDVDFSAYDGFEGDDWNPEEPEATVVWCGADPGEALSLEFLQLDGRWWDLEEPIGPLVPGTYWVGLQFPGSEKIAWADSIAVEAGRVVVPVTLPPPPIPDGLHVTVHGLQEGEVPDDEGEDDGPGLYFEVTGGEGSTSFDLEFEELGPGQYFLRFESEVPFAIVDGQVPGKLMLTAVSHRRFAAVPVTSRHVHLEFPARRELVVRLLDASPNAAYYVALEEKSTYHGGRQRETTPGVFRFLVQPGRYSLTVLQGDPIDGSPMTDSRPRERDDDADVVHTQNVVVGASDLEVGVRIPRLGSLTLRFAEEPSYVFLRSPVLQDRDREEGEDGIRFDRLPYGTYEVFAMSEGEALEFMRVEVRGDRVVDFSPMQINALELVRFEPGSLLGSETIDLQVGDHLVAISGSRFSGLEELQRAGTVLAMGIPRVRVTILRDGTEREVEIPTSVLDLRGAIHWALVEIADR